MNIGLKVVHCTIRMLLRPSKLVRCRSWIWRIENNASKPILCQLSIDRWIEICLLALQNETVGVVIFIENTNEIEFVNYLFIQVSWLCESSNRISTPLQPENSVPNRCQIYYSTLSSRSNNMIESSLSPLVSRNTFNHDKLKHSIEEYQKEHSFIFELIFRYDAQWALPITQ